ncbi:sigma-70 family RNA polymerase sigma factor [Sporosarcina thermotolerans]|uniref:Sigma-70 family RNA polymerase sigma factor n=1 Tax=Sporosarcina thermotolerans TaxID=633404 RepID=A0AAW9A9S2_9BACL|nr:sigma-70 family RNA polymerase sigma factor [Sporosarcina thermotolerans]MDW0117740.1 sigma-70 family RNA polymerase sigma factor [Sporosarcina thermotolerans]
MGQLDWEGMGRDEQIEFLMDEYGEEIKRLIYTYVKDHPAAEDLTQEIFITIYLKLGSFAGKSSIRTWIYSVAINKCKDYLKSWHMRKITVQENIKELLKSSRRGPQDEVIEKLESEQLVDLVLKLAVPYREVILLYYYKHLSIKEVSEILGVSESTVKVRLHRGREKLRMPLEQMERGEVNG